ncbi:helix-turn-helix domain-containing protein [Paeniglutamicibacter cryotolerans]|uniref:Excisionase family DNA binding protein n=1 Tax=Paeniglutamicibacter cryotolerans TaxID=670079 RepID=A0A839QN45_9MICC|nr:helix-turn-helix domain-containing protein [Paeniglutamicibacter cryotolerans]MBB2997669.1 excisionase family DNA binding protein [Paeniglutamicibacter cryotolerans]
MNVVTTREAADRLGISDVAVRKMLRSGRLTGAGTAGRTLLIDPASLQRVVDSGKHTGRLWSPRTAWAALCILSGQEAPWITAAEKYRLKTRLGDLGSEDVHLLARNRAAVKRYRGTPAAVDRLRPRLMPTAGSAMHDEVTAARFSLSGGGGFAEGYATAGDGEKFANALGLVEDPNGNVVIRETTRTEPFTSSHTPWAAVAVDLMDSLSTRERSAGIRVLEELLHG